MGVDKFCALGAQFVSTVVKIVDKTGEKVEYTESIDGAKNCVLFASDNSKTYSFIQDDEYITAFPAGTGNYYLTGKNWYDRYYCYFFDFIDTIALMPEEGGTFTCASETTGGAGKLEQSNATLTFEYESDACSVKIAAKNKNSLTQNVVIESYDPINGLSTTTMTFAYGSASVTIPDISDWSPYEEGTEDQEEQEPNKTAFGAAALSTLNAFMHDTLSAPALVATVKVNGQNALKETISDGVDHTEYPIAGTIFLSAEKDLPASVSFYGPVFYTDYVLKDILQREEDDYYCQIEDITETNDDKLINKTTLIFKCVGDGENIVLVATAENGLVRKIILTHGYQTASVVTTICIKYQ